MCSNLINVGVFVCALIMVFALPAVAATQTAQEQVLQITRQALANLQPFTAESLHNALLADATSLYIVSLQSADEYAKGHVPGAVRIQWDLANPTTNLTGLPRDKPIVITDSNGQLSCQVALLLCQLGYDARSLMLGMVAWNAEYAGTGAYPGSAGLPVTNAATPLPLGDISASQPSGLDDASLILQRTQEYARQGRPVIVSPKAVAAMKDDALIISMQTPEDYAHGHIAGAASLPAQAFIEGSPELLRLPRDKKIVVACYIGHYSNVGALILNQLGYEAYSLDWGLSGWNPTAFAKPLPLFQTKNAFPVSTH